MPQRLGFINRWNVGAAVSRHLLAALSRTTRNSRFELAPSWSAAIFPMEGSRFYRATARAFGNGVDMQHASFHLRYPVHLRCRVSPVAENCQALVVAFLCFVAPSPIFALESPHAQPRTQFRAGPFDAQFKIGEGGKVSAGRLKMCMEAGCGRRAKRTQDGVMRG
jgi:hypothetical protein